MCELWIIGVLLVVTVFLSTHEPRRESDSNHFWIQK